MRLDRVGTNRAPFIDSTTARIRPVCFAATPSLKRRKPSIKRCGQLVDELALIRDQADIDTLSTEILPNMQHNVRGLLPARSSMTTDRATEEGLLHHIPKRLPRCAQARSERVAPVVELDLPHSSRPTRRLEALRHL